MDVHYWHGIIRMDLDWLAPEIISKIYNQIEA